MIRASNISICETGENTARLTFRRTLLRGLWIIPSATLIIFLILFSLGRVRISDTHLLTMFVYSACIGVPSMVLLTRISVRYSPRFPRAIIPIQAICLIATAIGGSLAANLILWSMKIVPHGSLWEEFRGSLPFCIVISLLIGLSIATYETLQHKLQDAEIELRTRQVEHERAYKLLAEARLSSLESSIHPHFLFNTLNSIAALIPRDPQRAENMVGKLASLLRFSLNAQHSGLVPLEQELKFVRDYLEIESTRFGSRLRYEILVPDSLEFIGVPPLALQTLVENSIKHVASQRAGGVFIQVAGAVEGNIVRLEVIDDGPGFLLSTVAPEHGLGNLASRLQLLFGGAGRLEVLRQNTKTVVRISFPAEQ